MGHSDLSNQCVVDGSTGDTEVGESCGKLLGRLLIEKPGFGEVAPHDLGDLDRRAPHWGRETGQYGVRLEPGVAGQAENMIAQRNESHLMSLMAFQDQSHRHRGVHQ